jgi:uncharacterized linocin/CFP29 family protein
MSDKFLHRDDAPFDAGTWDAVDGAVVGAAKSQLAGRRLLHVDGPYGLGLKTLPGLETPSETDGGASITVSRITPVAQVQKDFVLPIRDIAAFESSGLPLDLGPAAAAAIVCAKQEDKLVFNGSDALGVTGLLNADGVQGVNLSAWDEPGTAAEDVIAAVTALDVAGFHGPYALALEPARYNLLFRRYHQGNQTEMDHVRTIVTDGVVKAPAVKGGGVVLASGRQFASIVLGQDLMAGFVGPDGEVYEFTVSESVALRLIEPGALCVLNESGGT